MSTELRRVGRPTKLTPVFLEVAKQILFTDADVIIYTDTELLDAINDELDVKERVNKRTFEKWKARAAAGTTDDKDWVGDEFIRLYKKALRIQKKALFQKMADEPQQWQKVAWIIERKFNDWNLKHIAEIDHTTKGESINQLTDAALDAMVQQMIAS